MSDFADRPLPSPALIGAGALVAVTLALTAAVPLGLLDRPQSAQSLRARAGVAVVASRELRFLDRADGAVLIEDVGEGALAGTVAPGGKTSFIRGVMRGLARDRKMRGIDAGPPFRLTLWANDRLSLQDSATGRTIELDSFGADNRAQFAALLPPVRVAAR